MIRGFVALLDHEKMGLPLTAYVDVALEHPRFEKVSSTSSRSSSASRSATTSRASTPTD